MPLMTPTDRVRTRTVSNQVGLIREHLEAMQRDSHGLEYEPWRVEVDALWKRTFTQINLMAPIPQQQSLESIRDLWTTYVSHYAVLDQSR